MTGNTILCKSYVKAVNFSMKSLNKSTFQKKMPPKLSNKFYKLLAIATTKILFTEI